MAQFKRSTTTDLITNGKYSNAATNTIIETLGYTTKGDGGGAQWKKTGVTGLTASQTPAQRIDAKLTDALGHEWELAETCINVRCLGAAGDDASDDSGPVQAGASACADQLIPLYIPAGDYLVTGSIDFNPTLTDLCQLTVRGDGTGSTVIKQQTNTSDTFSFQHNDTSRQFTLRPDVSDLAIEYNGTLSSDTGAAIRHRQALNGKFSNVVIESAPYGIFSERGSQCWYEKVYYRTNQVTTANTTQAVFVFDHDPTLLTGTSFGNFISNCESQTGKGVENTFDLRAVDGLKITNSHFDYAGIHILINPDTTGGRTTVRHVMASNCYFDSNAAKTMTYHIFVEVDGAGSASVFGIRANGCVFRNDAAPVFRVSGTVAGMSGLSELKDIQFIGNEFRGVESSVINFALDASYTAVNLIENVTVVGNQFNINNTNVRSNAIVVRGKNWVINGNTFEGVFNATSVVSIGDDTDGIREEGNLYDITGTNYVAVGGSAVDVVARSVIEEGSDSTDTWIKYSGGEMELRKTFEVTSVSINTAWGSLFISGSLSGTSPTMSQTFAATPDFFVCVRNTGGSGMPDISGTGSTTNIPTIQLVRATSTTGVTAHIDLLAKGTW
jgi:hypothetical protein